MEPLRTVRSRVVPLLTPNIDTDVITPMRRITGGSPHPMHHYAFEAMRYLGGDGDTGEPDPAFPLNDPTLADAQIMVTGPNFGCGSSRETAPMAIAALGFRVLIGPSFGDIFFNNCFQQGILPIVVDAGVTDRVASAGELTVDLDKQTIQTRDGDVIAFDVNPLRKACLLEGSDLVGLSLGQLAAIDAWQAADRVTRPWVWEPVT
jgi:3-isopropylmalate/(R)-2-methylmalate dehydratase small subunit